MIFGKEEPIEEWTEVRAIFTVPASIIDADSDREKGFVVKKTKAYNFRHEACAEARKNSDETHAHLIGYEERVVYASAWKASEK